MSKMNVTSLLLLTIVGMALSKPTGLDTCSDGNTNQPGPTTPLCVADRWQPCVWPAKCPPLNDCPIAWNELTVTSNGSAFPTDVYIRLPVSLLKNENLEPETSASVCSVGDTAHPYIGRPFVLKHTEDPFRLLFDANGFIVGVQLKIAKANLVSPFSTNTAITTDSDGNGYITVYFVYPNTQRPASASECHLLTSACHYHNGTTCSAPFGVDVCTTGRYPSDVALEGIGRGLWQQIDTAVNASDPNSLTKTYTSGHMPPNEKEASVKYTGGECLRGVGVSYLATTDGSDTRSATFANLNPVVPIYNAGRLNAFAFIAPIVAKDMSAMTANNMTISQLETMFGETRVPRMFYNALPSMIHVHLTQSPLSTSTC